MWIPSETVMVSVVPCGLSALDGVTVKAVDDVAATVASDVLLDVAVNAPVNPVSLAENDCAAFALLQPVFSCGL